MLLSDKQNIQQIVCGLAALGLREVILCPGSRNAPLIISFHRHPAFHCTSIRDERSAGFFALGKAIELNEPVAIVSTSGSASLNFAPALSEAFYQRIPLIAITADRLKEWTGQGDGQTIDQTDVYRNFIRKSFELRGEHCSDTDTWYNKRCLSDGWNIAINKDAGPVHFNIPVAEPLYGTEEVTGSQPSFFQEQKVVERAGEEALTEFCTQFNISEKVMILAGQQPADAHLTGLMARFAQNANVIVLTESTSNLHHEDFVENIDRCITGLEGAQAASFMPDLLITVGGAVVSKRIKALLRDHRPKNHWNIHPFDASIDTYQSLTHPLAIHPGIFFEQIDGRLRNVKSNYRRQWLDRSHQLKKYHAAFCESCAYSDLKVFSQVYKYFPANTYLHLANSSPIRYAQLFDNTAIAGSWSNRGTSGIDGCTSTAVGSAVAAPEKDFILITGDVAFHYDINGLWNEEQIPNLKIIVINNGGGGIFRIISGPGKVAELETFFETAMTGSVKEIAKHYGWNYSACRDEKSLTETLPQFFDRDTKKTILEIFTPAEQNPEVLDAYWKFLKEKTPL